MSIFLLLGEEIAQQLSGAFYDPATTLPSDTKGAPRVLFGGSQLPRLEQRCRH